MMELVLPYLIGSIILVAGLLFHFFPPKTINYIYGCRIPAAMRNQETWNEGNRYCANLIISAGIITCFTGAAGMYLFSNQDSVVILSAIVGVCFVLFSIPLTIHHLNTRFDSAGKPLKK